MGRIKAILLLVIETNQKKHKKKKIQAIKLNNKLYQNRQKENILKLT
jgi:hypothetical protein